MLPRVITTILAALCACAIVYFSYNSSNVISSFKTMKVPVDFCKPGKGSDCVAPFQPFIQKYRVAPKYDLNACVIEKAMSTVLVSIMCYLYDPIAFKNANRSVVLDTYKRRFCAGKNEHINLEKIATKYQSNMSLYTVVRNPIDRFISGFVDKCIMEDVKWGKKWCYGCKGNVTCFVQKQYKRMLRFSSGNPYHTGYEDIHFHPQSWYCALRMKFANYKIVHYREGKRKEKMVEEILEILRQSGVEEHHLTVIKEDVINLKTPHTTQETSVRAILEKNIRSDPHVMRLLVKMFYYDFVIFGFELPELPVE